MNIDKKSFISELRRKYEIIEDYEDKRNYNYFINFYDYIHCIKEESFLNKLLKEKVLKDKKKNERKLTTKKEAVLKELEETFNDIKKILDDCDIEDESVLRIVKGIEEIQEGVRYGSDSKVKDINKRIKDIIRYSTKVIAEDTFNDYLNKIKIDKNNKNSSYSYSLNKEKISKTYNEYDKLLNRYKNLSNTEIWGYYSKLEEIYNAINYLNKEGSPKPMNLGWEGQKIHRMEKIKNGTAKSSDVYTYFLDNDKEYSLYLRKFHNSFIKLIKQNWKDKKEDKHSNKIKKIVINTSEKEGKIDLLINDEIWVRKVNITAKQWEGFLILAKNKLENDYVEPTNLREDYGLSHGTVQNINYVKEGSKLYSGNELEKTKIIKSCGKRGLKLKENLTLEMKEGININDLIEM